jgi:hypothetical protein
MNMWNASSENMYLKILVFVWEDEGLNQKHVMRRSKYLI